MAITGCSSSGSTTAATSTTHKTQITYDPHATPSPFEMHQKIGFGPVWTMIVDKATATPSSIDVTVILANDGTASALAPDPQLLFTYRPTLFGADTVPTSSSGGNRDVQTGKSTTIVLHFPPLTPTPKSGVLFLHNQHLAGHQSVTVNLRF
jgi:hypothetical protein